VAAADYRYLHFATHGFFADPAVRSVLAPSDKPELTMFRDEMQRQVAGQHPGLLSGIVLAGANQPPTEGRDDGILTALEVGELDLQGVELVTLSACETGLGATAGGEGLLGLQRAFQTAGAHTTVATLWKVRDDATRSLMIDFYENLWNKKLTKLEALRQAQLSMLHNGFQRAGEQPGQATRGGVKLLPDAPANDQRRLPPYYWAAFVLSGDWR
jgi:CHAT domain-containing protein